MKKKRKTHDEALDIHNKIKIITSADSIFVLWSEVIASHNQDELYDPETNPLKKFKENKSWNREFFKWLGNLSEVDHRKFYKHILNKSGNSRIYSYFKVTMKATSSILISCYSVKEGIERRKQKQLVRKDLNKMKPRLQLFGANGEFNCAN
jgi:hypothetical protein